MQLHLKLILLSLGIILFSVFSAPPGVFAQYGLSNTFNCQWDVIYGCDINNSVGYYNCHPQSDYDSNRAVCQSITNQSQCQSAINLPCAPPPTPTAGPTPTGVVATFSCDLTNHWCLRILGPGGNYSTQAACDAACGVIYYTCNPNIWACSVSTTPTSFNSLVDCNTICRPPPANSYWCDFSVSFPICRDTCNTNYSANCTYDNQGRCSTPGTPVSCIYTPPVVPPPPPPFCDPSNPLSGLFTAFGCLSPASKPLTSTILSWSIGLAGITAFFVAAYAIFLLTTSSGDPKKIQAGRELLTAAIAGLVLIVLSVVLLNFLGVTVLNLPSFVGNPRL